MAISRKTRKTLWAKSGDRCASCRNKLIIDATENDGESIVSQECHIRSRKRKGPRHDPTYPKKKLDTVENLILLCNVHHKMVDDQVKTYTVERLTEMKADHEAWVSKTLDAVDQPGRPRQIPSPPADFVGREEEIREILDSLGGRGATISGVRGMGGIGKTALAYVIAEQLKPDFDAHFYVDLKGSEEKPMDPGDAQLRVLRAYSSDPTAKFPDDPEELTGMYRTVLSDRPALLLMDNAA
ncbi:MAG: HNH endonuclease, partial [Planctomycetes bacterium]|nr:HNH endonuclease [Planctomycetota bacterium]